MTDTKKTRQQERERLDRIIQHARNGHTMTEIVDREGLDPGNVKKWHKLIREAGVTIEMGRASTPPIGLTKATESWRMRVGRLLNNRLRDHHPQITVSRLVGITNVEINEAVKTVPYHDWTISQLQRLADACGITFEQLVKDCFTHVPSTKE